MEEVKKMILSQLPHLMETDPDIRDFILRVTRERYAGKEETESRFDRLLEELRRDREAQEEERAIQKQKWEAQEKKWEAQQRNWEAQQKKWEAQEQKWADWNKKWEEERRIQDGKWEANQKVINEMLASIKAMNQKHDATIGALGARWGLHSESAFRNGLRAILEESFGVKVERYVDYDYDGVVFSRPEQIEMDVIVYDGILILCEIKSSISKSDLYAFWRKKNFYEEKHGRKASRCMVISPMIDDRARSAAKELGIEVYGYADEVAV